VSDQPFKGKAYVVTGAAKGIGQGTAKKFCEYGAQVALLDVDVAELERTAKELTAAGYSVIAIPTDVSNDRAVAAAIAATVAKFGRVDGVANCAGIQTYGDAETTSEDTWNRTIDINVKSMFLTAKHAIPEMRKVGGGTIVNVSSVQSIVTQQQVLAYSTSKGAINALTRSLAIDYAAENIRVNAVLPGSVDTPLLRSAAELHKGNNTVEETLKEWGASHPIGRAGTMEEIGELICFLSGPKSTFMTGSSVVCDGGLTVQVAVAVPRH